MEGGEGADRREREREAPGWPDVQVNSTSASLPLVVKFKNAPPPNAQNCMNSLTDASRNWEFDLEMFEKIKIA